MIKYFEYGVNRNSDDTLEVEAYLIDDVINNYAEENGLEVISATCYKDEGIFVVFKKLNG